LHHIFDDAESQYRLIVVVRDLGCKELVLFWSYPAGELHFLSAIRIYEGNGKLVRAIPGEINYDGYLAEGSTCFSPGGEHVLVRDQKVTRCVDVLSGEVITTVYSETIAPCSVIAFSRDGKFLAAADENGVVRLQRISQANGQSSTAEIDASSLCAQLTNSELAKAENLANERNGEGESKSTGLCPFATEKEPPMAQSQWSRRVKWAKSM
jgi:hypothetical protein